MRNNITEEQIIECLSYWTKMLSDLKGLLVTLLVIAFCFFVLPGVIEFLSRWPK